MMQATGGMLRKKPANGRVSSQRLHQLDLAIAEINIWVTTASA
jgi:hypothetical protein